MRCRAAGRRTAMSRTWSVLSAAVLLAGKCLDDPGKSTVDGTQQQIWTCNGGANQAWTLADLGEGRVEVSGGQFGQSDLAQMRDQELLDVAGVRRPRGRADCGAGRQPIPQPPLQ